MYDNTIKLLKKSSTVNDYGTPVEKITSEREVFAEIASISMKESYEALAVGHHPEIKVIIQDDFDYDWERYARLADIEYLITRTYRKDLSIELTLERVNDNGST